MKPYYYGYLTYEVMKDLDNGFIWYGGMRQQSDMPDYFCPDCLEDIFTS